jgi:ectoine hydroxylase-related dioxygenase (phytanoyl-CoA dioxygenase family)
MNEGDMIVFDPSIVHSATNAEVTRYAYFATFFDAACDYILLPQRGASAPSFKCAAIPHVLQTERERGWSLEV